MPTFTPRNLLTPKQDRAVSALISYPNQEQAAQAIGITHGTFRRLIMRARQRARAHNNEQLVYLWTKEKIKDGINDHV